MLGCFIILMHQYFKYHALGNDYVVLDPTTFKVELTPSRIQRLCHRNLGIGSDGILYGPSMFSNEGIPEVRIYNPDGSEAEKSGNGIRIFTKYLFDQGYTFNNPIELKTKGGKVTVTKNNAEATNFTVAMGTLVIGEPQTVKLEDQEYCLHPVAIGNPHCIIIADDISEALARRVGPLIENHPYFPQRTNVQLVKVLDRENIQMEIWERGAGYTLASGSSSSAAAGVCHHQGLCGRVVQVHQPGGTLEILIKDDYEILLTGDVSSVAAGKFTPAFIQQLQRL